MLKEIKKIISVEDLGTTRKEAILSNGTKLVVFERSGMPVYMRAVFLGGSRFDPIEKDGTAHFLEHMVTAGTQKFPTKDKIAAYIERYGGSLSASTGPETLNINSAIGDPDDLEIGFTVLHEMLLAPLFDPKVIETERDSILKELGDKKSNPGEMIWEVYRRLFFQETALGRSTLGSEQSIKAITRDDLVKFYKDIFISGRMAIIVSGGAKIDEVKQLAEKHLLVPQGRGLIDTKLLSVNRKVKISIEPYLGRDQIHLVLGFRAAPIFHPDDAALKVIAEVLGGGRASVLNKKLRLEKGLVYSVNAWSVKFTDAGAWLVKTSTSKDKLQEVVEIIEDEIKRVVDAGLTPEEVNFAQDKIVKSKRMQLQSSEQWVNWHTAIELNQKQLYTLTDYIRSIMQVTPEMTKTVAQTYFGSDKWYLGMCGDISSKDAIVNF